MGARFLGRAPFLLCGGAIVFWRFIRSFSSLIATHSLTIASVVILVQVFLRYLFNFSFPWAEELARYLMIYLGMIGSAIVIEEDSHPSIDFLPNALSGKLKRWLMICFQIMICGFLVVLVVKGCSLVSFGREGLTPSLRIRWSYPYLAIPLGGILMFLFSLRKLLRILSADVKGHGEKQE